MTLEMTSVEALIDPSLHTAAVTPTFSDLTAGVEA